MIKWFKKLFYIVSNYDGDKKYLMDNLKSTIKRVKEAEALIKERTAINVDLGIRRSEIIVTGFYKNRDYVQVFQIDNEEMQELVERLKEMERYGVTKRIDGPQSIRSFVVDSMERF